MMLSKKNYEGFFSKSLLTNPAFNSIGPVLSFPLFKCLVIATFGSITSPVCRFL